MGEWMLVAAAVLMGVSVVGSLVTTLSAVRTLNEVSARADAQISRLMVLARAESMAEFAAMEKQMAKERLEAIRSEAIDGEVPQVATTPRRRSNLGIWGRRKPAPVPEGEKR